MPTVNELCDRYLAEHSKVEKKARGHAEDDRLIKKHIKPELGRLMVFDVGEDDIERVHRKLRKTPYLANRVLALLSHMFRMAEKWKLRPKGSNPCSDVTRFDEQSRERYLSFMEITNVGAALVAAEKNGDSPYAVAAVRLLMLTGARLNEILTLKWAYIDIDAGVARLPDSKTGVKLIYLPPPALQVLNSVKRKRGNPYVFCGQRRGSHIVNLQKFWRRTRKAAKLPDVRIHDLRHTLASVGVSGGLSLPILGKVLGHANTATTERYAHLADDPVKQAAHMIGEQIASAMKGQSGDVDPMEKRR